MSPNRYRDGWDAGRDAAEAVRRIATAEYGELDQEFLEGYADGLDQTINAARYAQIEMQRINDDLAKIAAEEGEGPPVVPTHEYMERRVEQELTRRMQAKRARRCLAGLSAEDIVHPERAGGNDA